MANPRNERIEPVLKPTESSADDDQFDIRLGEGDRTIGGGRARDGGDAGVRGERREPRLDDVEDAEFVDIDEDDADEALMAPRSRRSSSQRRSAKPARSRARNSGRRRSKGGGGVGRFLFRAVKWALVLVVLCTVGVAGAIGYYAARLPSTADWSVPKRPPNIKILANDGSLIANRGDTGGESIKIGDLPPYLPEAVVSIEDRRFYHHFGVDPIGLVRAAWVNYRSGTVVQGGSTLTQQLAKNLFLTPDRTLNRKIEEAIMALWLETKYSKAQILEAYLNRVYLGAGTFGVDAASRRYFGKSARDISLKEAAILAALLKAPSRYAPTSDPEAANQRANVVLAAMAEEGYISAADEKKAQAEVITAKDEGEGGAGRYVADWVADLVPEVTGALDKDVVVTTTIDPHLEDAAGRALSGNLDKSGKALNVSQGALVAIDGTGAVRALVGGRDYAKSQFDRAIAARRQPGSAFKPFVYLTALEFGLTPETVRVDEPVKIGNWEPKDFEKDYKGPVTLQTALALSLNTVAAQLANEVGPDRVINTAKRLGITSPLQPNPSIALGTSEVSPLELVNAYVPFANGGYGVTAHVITQVKSVDGSVLYQRQDPHITQIIDPTYVGMMNSMMQDTLLRGTARKAAIPNWQAAGKTGTSQDFRDAWFVGYTANLTAGIWLGNDDGKPTKRMTGGSLPAVIWAQFMQEAHKGVKPMPLPGDYTFRDPAQFDANAAPQQQIDQGGQTADQGGWQDPAAQGQNQAGMREVPPPQGGLVDPNTQTGSTRPQANYGYAGDPEAGDGSYDPAGNGSRNPYADSRYYGDANGPVPPADVGDTEVPPPSSYPQRRVIHRENFLQRLFGG